MLFCLEITSLISMTCCLMKLSASSVEVKNDGEVREIPSRSLREVAAQSETRHPTKPVAARGASSYCHQLTDNSTLDMDTLFLDKIGQESIQLGSTISYNHFYHSVVLDTYRNNSAWQIDQNGDTVIQFVHLASCLSGVWLSDVEIITPPDGYQCFGQAGPAVHDEKLYCNRRQTNAIIVYDLSTRSVTNLQPIPDAGNYFYNETNLSGYIDVMTDQRGFWALYGSLSRDGILTIQKFDPNTLIPLGVWYTEKMKTEVSNSFMIDGILYCTDTLLENATVTYAYSTLTSKGVAINDADFQLNNLLLLRSLEYNYRLNLLLSLQSYDNIFQAWSIHLMRCI